MPHINRGFSPASPAFLHQPLLSHCLLFCNHPSTQLSSYQSFHSFQLINSNQAPFHLHCTSLQLPTYCNEWFTMFLKYFLPIPVVCSLHFPYTSSLVINWCLLISFFYSLCLFIPHFPHSHPQPCSFVVLSSIIPRSSYTNKKYILPELWANLSLSCPRQDMKYMMCSNPLMIEMMRLQLRTAKFLTDSGGYLSIMYYTHCKPQGVFGCSWTRIPKWWNIEIDWTDAAAVRYTWMHWRPNCEDIER